jgi:hypothetical protein
LGTLCMIMALPQVQRKNLKGRVRQFGKD